MYKKSIKRLLWVIYILLGLKSALWTFLQLIAQAGMPIPTRPDIYSVVFPLAGLLFWVLILILSFLTLKKLFSTQYTKKIYWNIILLLTLFPILIGFLLSYEHSIKTLRGVEEYRNRETWVQPDIFSPLPLPTVSGEQ